MNRFFHAVLNERLVHQREHLFWLGLRGGQEARTQTCGGKDGLADLWNHHHLLYSQGSGYTAENALVRCCFWCRDSLVMWIGSGACTGGDREESRACSQAAR